MFILAILRFASSKVTLSSDMFGLQDKPFLLSGLVVVYAVLLIMYFELSNGVLRYSMLDTSIRTNEVYVMNPQKIVGDPFLGTRRGLVLSVNITRLCIARLRIAWHGEALQGASGNPSPRWRGWEELKTLVADMSCDEPALHSGGRSCISHSALQR